MIATYVFQQNLTEFDAAMTVWSKTDKAIGRKISHVIRMSHNFAKQIFQEMGFDEAEVALRSRLFLGYIVAARDMFGPNEKNARAANDRLVDMLISRSEPR